MQANLNPTRSHPRFSLLPGSLLLAAVVLFMGMAAAIYWPEPEVAFRSDQSPVSWLSSALLLAIAVLAIRQVADRGLPRWLAIWLGFSIFALALDEQFMFHEQWKYGCTAWLAACAHDWVREMPTLLVGVLGLLTAGVLHRALPPRGARVVLWLALVTGILALKIDLLGGDAFLAIYEEGLEVLAETFFATVLLGLSGAADQVHSP